jgi:hypothetical protein
MKKAVITIIAAGACLLAVPGCLVTSGNCVQESGVRVSSNTLAQIEVGQTTEAWLVAALGEPDARAPVEGEENVQILRYNHTVSRSGHGTVFLVFAGHHDTHETASAYFEVTDGIITRYWTEP